MKEPPSKKAGTTNSSGVTIDAKKKYAPFVDAALKRLEEHRKSYKELFHKPVLFIALEKSAYANAIVDYLIEKQNVPESEILNIHTNSSGEITNKDLDKAREAAKTIDSPNNPFKIVVSVMMLREGWDVKNVTVVLGLRPFSAKSKILPEQIIGRGLRLMQSISPDNTQTLEVMGTKKLLQTLQDELDQEGVGVGSTDSEPIQPVQIFPDIKNKILKDISIPITRPSLIQNIQKLREIELNRLEVMYDKSEIRNQSTKLTMEFFEPKTIVHSENIDEYIPTREENISKIVKGIEKNTGITNHFQELVILSKNYLEKRCFGQEVDLGDEQIRLFLSKYEVQDKIVNYISDKVSTTIVEKREFEIEKRLFNLSSVTRFTWRRNLPLVKSSKTIFNFVATFNEFEKDFAKFLNKAEDVDRFASLGTTEQESWSGFRIDYIKLNGRRAYYYPDWIVVQRENNKEIFWIIETKGRVWADTHRKDEAIQYWCERVSELTKQEWKYIRINQIESHKNMKIKNNLKELINDM